MVRKLIFINKIIIVLFFLKDAYSLTSSNFLKMNAALAVYDYETASSLFLNTEDTFNDEEEAMRRYFHEYGVEGVFTNFPDKGVTARAKP